MKLLEIVRADATGPAVLATAFGLARRLGKIPVAAGVCDGFIGNRILSRYRRATNTLLLEGATPRQIDLAMRAFGYPMGPTRRRTYPASTSPMPIGRGCAARGSGRPTPSTSAMFWSRT